LPFLFLERFGFYNSLNNRLIQGECVPVFSAIRLRGIAPKTSCNAFALCFVAAVLPSSLPVSFLSLL
jgi:hypothetical protein